MKNKILIGILASVFCTATAQGQVDTSAVYEMSLEELMQQQVSTVTLKSQKITDVPGIVSVITQEDLQALGVRTIREALTMVAGFAPLQNDDEQILGVRGIFATTNQKILVMRDGHALNEANLDIPQTEYSLSIENIKKIEIIRGPGASIYGNSALAAVVNIITKDTEGAKAKIGFGNYGQLNIEGYTGVNTKNDGFLLAYGRFARTSGEASDVTVKRDSKTSYPGTYKTYKYPQNYDMGFKYNNKLISLGFSSRLHEYDSYWSSQGKFTNLDSIMVKPRLIARTTHFDLAITPKINDKIGFKLQNYADYCNLNNYRQIGPIDSIKKKGNNSIFEWNVFKMGANYYGYYDYSEKGQILIGGAIEQRYYLESYSVSNAKDNTSLAYSSKPFIPEGRELRGAGFFQLQHNIFEWLKGDLGARYDVAQKFKSSFNPRAAIIISPLNNLTAKAIYTKAFQAPGYSYRSSNVPFAGSVSDLSPEELTTYQGSIRYEFQKTSFIEVAAYYNQLKNLITRYSGTYYENYGKLGTYGIEVESRYNHKIASLFANYTLLLPDTSYTDEKFKAANIKNNAFKHFSKHSVNAGIIGHISNKIDISLSGQYGSSFFAVNNEEIKARFIMNSTIVAKNFYKGAEVSFSVYNLANTQWKLGDPSVIAMPQAGRWFMGSIAYNF